MRTSGPPVRTFSPGPDSTKTPDPLLGLSPTSPGPALARTTRQLFRTPLRSSTSPGPVPSGTTPSRGQALSLTSPLTALPPRTRVQLPRLSTRKLLRQREVPGRPEGAAETHPELLPSSPIPVPGECAAGRDVEGGADSEKGAAGRPHTLIVPRRGRAGPRGLPG